MANAANWRTSRPTNFEALRRERRKPAFPSVRTLRVADCRFEMPEADMDGELAGLLLSAERQIRLIERVAPQNWLSERERLLGALTRQQAAAPQFRYAARPGLVKLRTELGRLVSLLEHGSLLARLYALRAMELEREAALVDAIGSVGFATLARDRFVPDALDDPRQLEALVRDWLNGTGAETDEAELATSDDECHPHSLLSILRGRIGAARLPVRVEIRPALPTLAAAGQDVVLLRPGVALSRGRAERIAVHELEAHVFPRCAARAEALGLFRAGFAGASEHEEGRALLIEDRGGFMNAQRRRELSLRHRAAVAVRDGATLVETVRALTGEGSQLEAALDIGLRALRGGGLAREVVYLPAYLAVRSAFREQPRLERYLERGRVSIAGARLLDAQSISTTSSG